MSRLLIENAKSFLPVTSPWETAGGCAEQSTVMFLRGCILSSLGMVEMQLKQMAFACSTQKEYYTIREKAPWKRLDFIKYLRKVADISGPLKSSNIEIIEICDNFESQFSIRDCWAHGHLIVLPGSAENRWDGAWITVESFISEKNEFKLVKNRWSHDVIELQAATAKELADECNLAYCELKKIISFKESGCVI